MSVSEGRRVKRSVEVRSVGAVHVVDAGSGTPVLLLHGISSSSDAFRRQMEELADAYRLIAWDAPGYARSADPPGPPGMDGYAEAAKRVLDALDVESAHVVGVSWGGVVATRLALRHPGRVASLALVGSTPGRGTNPEAAKALRNRSERISEKGGVIAYARSRAPRVLAPEAPEALVEEVRHRIVASVRMPGYRYAAESLAETDHRAELPSIGVPALVLVGEHDGVTGLEDSRILAQSIPGSRLVVVPGAGHLANQEKPEAVNEELRRHWEEVVAGRWDAR